MAEINMLLDWPEVLALLFLTAGFAMALASGNTIAVYAIPALAGLFFGRLYYRFRKSENTALFLIMITFFLGFIVGGMWANLKAIALLLIAGIIAGYWVHAKKYLRTI